MGDASESREGRHTEDLGTKVPETPALAAQPSFACHESSPMKFFVLAVCLLVTSYQPGVARADGVEGTASVQQSGQERNDFAAQLSLTADEQALRKSWDTSSENPQLRVTDSVRLGSDVTTVLIFRGCMPDATGKCDVAVEFSLMKPNGKSVNGGTGSLWSSAPLPHKYMLGAASMTLAFNSKDDLGSYQVRAKVVDRVAARIVELVTPLRVEGNAAASN